MTECLLVGDVTLFESIRYLNVVGQAIKEKLPCWQDSFSFAVGARGFEPPTSCTPCKRASRTAPRPD